MRVPEDWEILFTKTPEPESHQVICRCTWCGWTVRVARPTDPVPGHECPGPQPRHEPPRT